MTSLSKPFRVLLIEDNSADITMMEFLFSQCGFPVELHTATDGVKGSDFLFKRGDFAESPTPDLILMDLNLPLKEGREILRERRNDDRVCKIPVIMVTTSSSYREISEAYCLGANAFISKPTDLQKWLETIKSLADFWFKQIDLPTRIGHRL